MIEQETTMIQFVSKEKDHGTMVNTLQSVYNLTLEIQSAQEAIKDSITNGYEVYKEKIDDTASKGDYSKFIKKAVAELLEGKVTEEVKVLENILDYVDVIKKDVH